MNIKKLNHSKTEDIDQLFLRVFSSEPWNETWTTEMVHKRLEGLLVNPMTVAYVAYDQQELVGCLIGHLTSFQETIEFFVDEFFIDSTRQRAGIGTAMMEFVEDDLKMAGVGSITLLTAKGFPSESFYLKQNYKQLEHLIFMYKNI